MSNKEIIQERWYIAGFAFWVLAFIGFLITASVVKPSLYRHPEWCLYYGAWVIFIWVFPYWLIGKMSEE